MEGVLPLLLRIGVCSVGELTLYTQGPTAHTVGSGLSDDIFPINVSDKPDVG